MTKAELVAHSRNVLFRLNHWLTKYSEIAVEHSKRREAESRSKKLLAKAIIGLFTGFKEKPNRIGTTYYLQGLRNLHYLKSIDPNKITIVGSRTEKKFASANGYKFIWSFPIEGACHVSRNLNSTFLLRRAFKKWVKLLSGSERSILIVYEDTQPTGAFLSELGKVRGENFFARSICVQHGYFPVIYNGLPNDGSFTEFNFVWDRAQCDIIGCERQKTFDIGPPVLANVVCEGISRVIFVGTGTNGDGTTDYEETISEYCRIYQCLPPNVKSISEYRPHPNERGFLETMEGRECVFAEINSETKEVLFKSGRSIFIGTVSSLLFEAYYCGHLVIGLDVCKTAKLSFLPQFRFGGNTAKDVAGVIVDLVDERMVVNTRSRHPECSFSAAIQVVEDIIKNQTCVSHH